MFNFLCNYSYQDIIMKFLIVAKSIHQFSATHVAQKVNRVRLINYQNCHWYVFCQSTNYFITVLKMESYLWNLLPCCQSHTLIKHPSLFRLFNIHINFRHSDKGRARLWRLAAEHRLHPEHKRSVPSSRQAGGGWRSVGPRGQKAA